MMRALWTGASGMTAQQTNLDTIANNFSNIATTGYKKETSQFASLLYQKIQTKTTDNEGNKKPVIGQVGLGVRNTAIVSQFSQGSLQESQNNWDMAIEGNGFFMIQLNDGTTAYTRNGSFGLAIGQDGVTLANTDGFAVLDSTGEPISFSQATITATLNKVQEAEAKAGIDDDSKATELDYNNIHMDDYGNLTYTSKNNISVNMGVKIGLAQFNNPAGLEKLSGSLFGATGAANFFSRATKWVSILFFACTLGLAYIGNNTGRTSGPATGGGVMQGYEAPAPASGAPAAPAAQPQADLPVAPAPAEAPAAPSVTPAAPATPESSGATPAAPAAESAPAAENTTPAASESQQDANTDTKQ